jgi:hypothetical protein
MSASIPEGETTSFSKVQAGVPTGTFTFPGGFVVITFNPVDENQPGTLTLYDSGNNSLLVMPQGGRYPFQVPSGGASYYFSSTAAIATVAMTLPNNLQRA